MISKIIHDIQGHQGNSFADQDFARPGVVTGSVRYIKLHQFTSFTSIYIRLHQIHFHQFINVHQFHHVHHFHHFHCIWISDISDISLFQFFQNFQNFPIFQIFSIFSDISVHFHDGFILFIYSDNSMPHVQVALSWMHLHHGMSSAEQLAYSWPWLALSGKIWENLGNVGRSSHVCVKYLEWWFQVNFSLWKWWEFMWQNPLYPLHICIWCICVHREIGSGSGNQLVGQFGHVGFFLQPSCIRLSPGRAALNWPGYPGCIWCICVYQQTQEI